MKHPSLILLLMSVIGLGFCLADEPAASVDPPAGPVTLVAVSDSSSPELADLTLYQKVALEILATTDGERFAAAEAVPFVASRGCGGVFYPDDSFTMSPGDVPYDQDGNRLAIPLEPPGADGPTSLVIAYYAALQKGSVQLE